MAGGDDKLKDFNAYTMAWDCLSYDATRGKHGADAEVVDQRDGTIEVEPEAKASDRPLDRYPWRFVHDSALPGVFHSFDVRAFHMDLNPGDAPAAMDLRVLDFLEFGNVRIKGVYREFLGTTDDCFELEREKPAWPTRAAMLARKKSPDPDSVELPLTDAFLIARRKITGGSVLDSGPTHWGSQLWRFPMSLDTGIVLVFAYGLRFLNAPFAPKTSKGMCEVVKLDEAELKDKHFMPVPKVQPPLSAPISRASGAKTTVTDGKTKTQLEHYAPRVLVVVNVSTLRERPDFEPGGVVGMARLHPHVMVVSSIPLDEVTVSVRMKRPETSSMKLRAPASPYEDGMKSRVTAGLYSDNNDRQYLFGLLPLPFWENMFTNVDLDPRGTFVVVDPEKKAGDPFATLERYWLDERSGDATTRTVTVRGVPRQGQFDNIHWATRLVLPPVIREDFATKLAEAGAAGDVVMAPFCLHDCLHLHWRWGLQDTNVSNMGWSDGWVPNSRAGAPMVPPNQKVFLTVDSPSDITYTAVAADVKANQWQVFMHHGAAQALALVGVMGEATLTALSALFFAPVTISQSAELRHGTAELAQRWSLFYWHLRYAMRRGTIYERLKVRKLEASYP